MYKELKIKTKVENREAKLKEKKRVKTYQI